MKRNILFRVCAYYLIVISLFLASCYPSGMPVDPYIVGESRQKENMYYVPSAPNVPLLSEKNDLNFNVISATSSKFSGVEIQSAYLPTGHIGIKGSYSHSFNRSEMKYNRFEMGSGYVTKFAKNWHFETYAGLGNGKITNRHHTGSSKLNLTHFYLQPAIAVSNEKKTVQLGFFSRFEGVHFEVMDTLFNNDREPFSTRQVKSLYEQPFHVMWQPGLLLRFGWKNFQLHTGYSLSANLTNPDLYRAKNSFSFGLFLRFNTKEKIIVK